MEGDIISWKKAEWEFMDNTQISYLEVSRSLTTFETSFQDRALARGRVLRIKAFNTAHGQLWCLIVRVSVVIFTHEHSSGVSSPATVMSLWWGVEAQLVTLKFGLNLLRTMVTWYRIQLNSPSNYGHVTSQLKGQYGATIERNQSNC